MIHISCGHEKSIGLEVLFKSYTKLSLDAQNAFCLYANKQDIEKTLSHLDIDYKFLSKNKLKLQEKILTVTLLDSNDKIFPSSLSLQTILDVINPESDILLTLPTSKNQLILNGKSCAGYTEYLRFKYNSKNLCMYFSAPEDHVLLITDHIPLREVSSTITEELIINKISTAIKYHSRYFFDFEEILIAGINPHAGENGILGHEDSVIETSILKLQKKYDLKFAGPISGDTLHFFNKPQIKQLKVYMYHDQGLVAFKAKNGVIGLNITLGLPFLRMSVDHGTAFDLFSKNLADESGCLYMLNEAYKAHQQLTD